MREIAHAALQDAKGVDLKWLDVRPLTDITDYMLIATGTSQRHVQTLAARVLEKMRAAGHKPLGVEGEADGEWVLVDFVDVVVHIMRAETRAHYDLEGLWDESLGEILGSDGLGDQSRDPPIS